MLEDLYYGNLTPFEKHVKRGSEYDTISKELSNTLDVFFSFLNEEERKIYRKIESDFSKLNSIAEKESFIDGFRIGAQIILEIMNYKNENFL